MQVFVKANQTITLTVDPEDTLLCARFKIKRLGNPLYLMRIMTQVRPLDAHEDHLTLEELGVGKRKTFDLLERPYGRTGPGFEFVLTNNEQLKPFPPHIPEYYRAHLPRSQP